MLACTWRPEVEYGEGIEWDHCFQVLGSPLGTVLGSGGHREGGTEGEGLIGLWGKGKCLKSHS